MKFMLSDNRGVIVNSTLLLALILHNLAYPLSAGSGPWPAVFYLFYASMFVLATWALTSGWRWRFLSTLSGATVLVTGLANTYAPTAETTLAVIIASILYHALMCTVLALYTFRARVVMTDVVLAATSLYLVIGSGFAAVFSLIEWLAPGSFTSSAGIQLGWQQMLYYSYVTLTTVGYGDITPVGFYAQAFASFEAILGVLYTVILLSRLVGLHQSNG